MAFSGTLRDFGIADVLQRVGQQLKSGVLHVRDREKEIHLVISEGSVVAVDDAGRPERDRLGSMLVRSGLLAADELERALAVQKRTLRRLGDVLVAQGAVRREELREVSALQTRETVQRLFSWKSGVYEFEPRDVEYDRDTVSPLPCEQLLALGFRVVDEWPAVRRKISSPHMTFERLRVLDPEVGSVGAHERRVDALAIPGRTVATIADLSRLGEFEAEKALFNLVNLGVLHPLPPARRSPAREVEAYARGWRSWLRPGAVRPVVTVLAGVALAVLAVTLLDGGRGAVAVRPLADDRAGHFVSRYEEDRIRAALEVYRLERGSYPPSLVSLVEAGLLSRRDLSYPWGSAWWYLPEGSGYRLLPPLE